MRCTRIIRTCTIGHCTEDAEHLFGRVWSASCPFVPRGTPNTHGISSANNPKNKKQNFRLIKI